MNFDKIIVKRFSKYVEPKLQLEADADNKEKSLQYDKASDTYKYVSMKFGFVVTYNVHTKELTLTTVKPYPGVTDDKGHIFDYQNVIPKPINIVRDLQNKYLDIGNQLELASSFYDRMKQLIDENYIDITNAITFTKHSKTTTRDYEFIVDLDEVKVILGSKMYTMSEINTLSEKLTKIANEVYSVLTNSETLLSR